MGNIIGRELHNRNVALITILFSLETAAKQQKIIRVYCILYMPVSQASEYAINIVAPV